MKKLYSLSIFWVAVVLCNNVLIAVTANDVKEKLKSRGFTIIPGKEKDLDNAINKKLKILKTQDLDALASAFEQEDTLVTKSTDKPEINISSTPGEGDVIPPPPGDGPPPIEEPTSGPHISQSQPSIDINTPEGQLQILAETLRALSGKKGGGSEGTVSPNTQNKPPLQMPPGANQQGDPDAADLRTYIENTKQGKPNPDNKAYNYVKGVFYFQKDKNGKESLKNYFTTNKIETLEAKFAELKKQGWIEEKKSKSPVKGPGINKIKGPSSNEGPTNIGKLAAQNAKKSSLNNQLNTLNFNKPETLDITLNKLMQDSKVKPLGLTKEQIIEKLKNEPDKTKTIGDVLGIKQ